MKRTKRSLLLRLVLAAVLGAAGTRLPLFAQNAGTRAQAQDAVSVAQPAQAGQAKADIVVVKSYELKSIGASEFMRSAKFYVLDSTGTEKSLTVRLMASQIPAFEALLKKLDVERKNIQFRVYAIAASKGEPSPATLKSLGLQEAKEIQDRDLKKVLDEMSGIWSFKRYWFDGPSFLLVKEGSRLNRALLVGPWSLALTMGDVNLRADETGRRIISVGDIALSHSLNEPKQLLLSTSDVAFKERGYLVVGVSSLGFPWQEMALILVINAEVK